MKNHAAIALLLLLLGFQSASQSQGIRFDGDKEAADRMAAKNLQIWMTQKERHNSPAYGPFYRYGPESNLLDLDLEKTGNCRTHIWGKASHSHAKPGGDLNEDTAGLGIACRINKSQTHRFWWAADSIRNSVRKTASFTGPIYEYPLFKVFDFQVLAGGQLAFINYETQRGPSVKGVIVVPGLTIEGGGPFRGFALDVGRIPLADVTMMRISVRAYVLFD